MEHITKPFIQVVLLMLAAIGSVTAQTITGSVTNKKNEPVVGASVKIKGSPAGTATDSLGNFLLTRAGKGKRVIQVSSIGYRTTEQEVSLADSTIHLDIVMDDESKDMGEVVVTGAGSFEASDKAKGASLTPMDAVTVAGSNADLANALRSLPGVQQIGEKEGLFVRGGSSEEAKQFVDGTWLRNPNYSSVPNVPQYARLNPFLFRGILFSSGGYSALYGQALSSALILETVDLADKSSAGFHIFPQHQGAGFQALSKSGKNSYGVNAGYGNLHLYNKVVPQKPDFFHGPEYASADANFHTRTSKTGMLKFYTNYGYSHTGMRNTDVDSAALFSTYEVKGTNWYTNLSWRESLKNNWKIDAGAAYNYYREGVVRQLQDGRHEQVFIAQYPYNGKNAITRTHSNFTQERIVMTKRFTKYQAFRFGGEHFYSNDEYRYNDSLVQLNDHLVAAFAEGDIYIARNLAAKIGIRTEHSSLLNKWTIGPRISLAYRWSDGGQINLAYGIFYQKPENMYLSPGTHLDFIRAAHYIINYQKKARNRLFRIEAYYKQYNDLIVTKPGIQNAGTGYAKGIELFWRDKRTFKDFDYWVSYTYLDTKRKFLDYPSEMQPAFATPHTASIAVKRYFQDINFSANLSYTLATGRPYYNIQHDVAGKPFLNDKGTTNVYNGLNLSFAYLFSMFPKWKNKDFSGIGFGINNVLGNKPVFGYSYSADGRNRMPVTLTATRSYYIGIFMSLGIDRRDDFINESL